MPSVWRGHGGAVSERSRPDAWGVHQHWTDAAKKPQKVADATVSALRAVIGEPPPDLDERAPIVVRPGQDTGLGRVEVRCEDGSTRTVDGALPEDFPLGYHEVDGPAGASRRLIVSPGRCWLPDDWRAWGWTVQLYAARSSRSWGIGDLADLRTLREWAAAEGAGFLLVNPLHAVGAGFPQESSPYLPATRRFRNPVYLRPDEVQGADRVDLGRFEERRRALNEAPLIDRDAVWELKREALQEVFEATELPDEFVAWRAAQGEPLEQFARWSVLSAEHGADWHAWPDELQQPSVSVGNAADVTFHAWLQWLLDLALHDASGDLTVIQDLPIGVSGGGADAWVWQDQLAAGVRVGAPPDVFNAAGQDWGSPPLIPWRMRASGYDAFIETIRSTIAGGGGLRIDHVMGLFRLWWVPEGRGPADGAYVRYPSEDLMDIVALESHRAEALVVGEDLGTVEPGVREALAEHNILSYRLLWFEEEEPDAWPVAALAGVSTHDLPTVAGLWTGADVADQQKYVDTDPIELERGRREMLGRLDPDGVLESSTSPVSTASTEDAVLLAYRTLARAPSVLLSATLEDAIADERRPNLPAVTERPNWSIPLAVHVEDLRGHRLAAEVAQTLRKAVK
jgi:4-alpha-glucanotransferase